MIVEVRSRSLELNPKAEERFQELVTRALGNHSGRVRQVTVRIVDINGPRGGVDKLCRVTAELVRGGTLVAEGRGENAGQAVARAATRTRARVGRWAQLRGRAADMSAVG